MTVTTPAGFRAPGVAAGLKTLGRQGCRAGRQRRPAFDSASVFTANRCLANPVLWSKEVVKDGVVRAVVLNSGGANCYTGPEASRRRTRWPSGSPEASASAPSTWSSARPGLIGLCNDRDALLAGVDAAYDGLSSYCWTAPPPRRS